MAFDLALTSIAHIPSIIGGRLASTLVARSECEPMDDGEEDRGNHDQGQKADEQLLADGQALELGFDLHEVFADQIHGLHASLQDAKVAHACASRAAPQPHSSHR